MNMGVCRAPEKRLEKENLKHGEEAGKGGEKAGEGGWKEFPEKAGRRGWKQFLESESFQAGKVA